MFETIHEQPALSLVTRMIACPMIRLFGPGKDIRRVRLIVAKHRLRPDVGQNAIIDIKVWSSGLEIWASGIKTMTTMCHIGQDVEMGRK